MTIPKIQIRGSFTLIVLVAILSLLAIYFTDDYSKQHTQEIEKLQQEIINKKTIDVDVLNAQERELKKQSDELNIEVNRKKKEEITKFNKDEFAVIVSTFAKANNLKLSNFRQYPVKMESDGFYTVEYNLTFNGSMHGLMNFFNLIEGLGSQYSINYLSFRQEGSYDWLKRETDVENSLPWAGAGVTNQTINPEKLQEIKELSIKVENDDYDYGAAIPEPTIDPDYNPLLENVFENMMKQQINPEEQRRYESQKAEQDKKTKTALAQKEADTKKINEFLAQHYPPGTAIKNGQIIVPMLKGNMVFDIGISFTGNNTGTEPKPNIDQYLISSEAVTSQDKNVRIVLDGKERRVPSIIKGVDVTDIDGLIINKNAKFVVSWNNNQIPKEVLENFLREKVDSMNEEINKVAAEIRFLQQYNKEELDLKKYLIFLYLYQQNEKS